MPRHLAVQSNTPGSYRRVKMPMLSRIPSIKEVRSADRMPLDCARDIIYTIAKEVRELESSVSYFYGLDTISFDEDAPHLAGLHDHLFKIIMRLVIDIETGPEGTKETSLNKHLHNYENLYYITIYHLCMLYHELHRDFSAGRLDLHDPFTEHLTAETMVKHLYTRWSDLVDPVLLATLDFSIRKEQVMDFKTMHNMAVFMGSGSYDLDRDFWSIKSSIRRGLDAVAFDESQLDSGDYRGLVPELFDKHDFASALLHYLRHHNASHLGAWCSDNDIIPSYRVFDDTQRTEEAKFWEFFLENKFKKEREYSESSIAAPDVCIPEENIPRPIDFNKVCNYLPYVEEADEYDSDSDYDFNESECDEEMEDPFSETVPCPPSPPTSIGTGSDNSKKRGSAPCPIDTALANGRCDGAVKRPRHASPAPPTISPLTGCAGGPCVSPWPWYVPPAARTPVSVLPSPTWVPVYDDATITHPAETRAQHAHDMVLNGEMMRDERERALRALCGEETAEDEKRKWEDADAIEEGVIVFLDANYGP